MRMAKAVPENRALSADFTYFWHSFHSQRLTINRKGFYTITTRTCKDSFILQIDYIFILHSFLLDGILPPSFVFSTRIGMNIA